MSQPIDIPLVLAVALGTLQALDALLTLRLLQDPNLNVREANPLLAWLFERVGLLPGLLLAKGGSMALIWHSIAAMPAWLLAALCALYGWVCWHNIQQLRR